MAPLASLLLLGCGLSEGSFADVEALLADAAAQQEVPGLVALAGDKSGRRYVGAHGNLTNDGRPPFGSVTAETTFDLASLTKVVATTSAVALLYQEGHLDLQARVASPELLGPYGFGAEGKDLVTVQHCLTHSAGFPPDPSPCYWDPSFGCDGAPLPETAPDFRCASRAFADLNSQVLARAPGEAYQYSDLSMITLMYVVGQVVRSEGLVDKASLLPDCSGDEIGVSLQCHFEAFVRTRVLGALAMTTAGYRPASSQHETCAPTAVPHVEGAGFRTLQGEVNDGNAFFLGGISGHAGLFARVGDLELLVRALLFPSESQGSFLKESTVRLFTGVQNASFSSRALGWDTNSSLCGTGFSAQTFTHTGYTGTQICADPATERYSILLTNRVYPIDDAASSSRISSLRKRYNTAAAAALAEKFSVVV